MRGIFTKRGNIVCIRFMNLRNGTPFMNNNDFLRFLFFLKLTRENCMLDIEADCMILKQLYKCFQFFVVADIPTSKQRGGVVGFFYNI